MAQNIYQIEKLDEQNYPTWSIQMKSILINSDMWDIVCENEERPTGDAVLIKKFDSLNAKALATITLGVKPTQLQYLKNCNSSVTAWKKLSEVHAPKGAARKTLLFKRLLYMTMAERDDVVKHLNKFCETYDMLEEVDIILPDEVRSIILLSSLPKSFEHFIIAMETRDEMPKFENLKIKLLEEAERKQQSGEKGYTDEAQQAFGARSKLRMNEMTKQKNGERPRGKCFSCGKIGHFAKYCKNQRKRDECSLSVVATLDEGKLNKNKWYVDSGASSHMSNNRDWFLNIEECNEKIQLAGNLSIPAIGKGDIKLKLENNTITLTNVLYAPTLKANFLSVSKAVSKGSIVIFEKKFASIKQNGEVVLKAKKIDNLYEFESLNNSNRCYLTKSTSTTQWHMRYGHLNFQTLTQMAKREVVNNLKLSGKFDKCEVCMRSKIFCKPFPKQTENRSKYILELIHSDICGPFKMSIGGSRYFLTFIDDMSRKIYVYFIKSKDETFQKFKEFKAMVERSTGRNIKKLRSDNGGEYMSKEFTHFLKESGIQRQLTVPYTPQQNGVAERANRTLVEMARAMLLNAGSSTSLWAEAIATAAYLRNRSSSKVINNKTPYEMWSGKKPSVKHLRVFGSIAVGLSKSQKSKMDAKGETFMMVGYSLNSKAYRLYDVVNKKVIEKRDVLFDETKFLSQRAESKEILEVIIGKTPKEVQNNNINTFNGANNDIYNHINQSRFQEFDKNYEVENDANFEEYDENGEEYNNNKNDELELEQNIVSRQGVEDNNGNFTEPAKRGPGRPRIIRNGKPGHPKKQFNMLNQLKQEIPIPRTVAEALNGEYSQEWRESMQKEYDSLLENKTWKLVELPSNKKAIGCKWVYSLKRDKLGEIQRFKSRLVAKGCSQNYGVDYKETFSPVVRYSTVRLIIALACELKLYLHQMDVTTAYLNGNLQEDVYMKQPGGFIDKKYPNRVLKLQKSLYGLKQSGREWNIKLDETLKNMGFRACPSEPCVYTRNKDGKFNIITVYVDDIIIACSDKNDLKNVKFEISSKFKIVDGGQLTYFLGMEIDREGELGDITIGQRQYVNKLLEQYGMENCKPVETPLEAHFKVDCKNEECAKADLTKYKSLIGALMYLALTTRPDIMHSVTKLSQRNADPHKEHEVGAKRILRYLKGTVDFKLHYKNTGYADADWAGDASDRKSYNGFVFMAAGGAFSWESKKQNVVALSSTEAEYMALSSAAKEATFISKLLKEIGFEKSGPIMITGDNQSAQQLVRNPRYHPRSKHIDIKYHYVREIYNNKIIDLNYISTEKMVADIFTKNLQKIKHKQFVGDMSIY